jgi:hypothetical protein
MGLKALLSLALVLSVLMFGLVSADLPNCSSYEKRWECKLRRKTHPCMWNTNTGKCRFDSNWVAPVDNGGVNIANCLADSTQCPRYPPGVFEDEYPRRYQTGDNKPSCYIEHNTPMGEVCDDVCRELFETYTQDTTWGVKVTKACRIGCGYADISNSGGDSAESCMKACKNTVWHYKAGMQKCNWMNGLGIAVFEMTEFGAGKACEMGCVIGNERPCLSCNTK